MIIDNKIGLTKKKAKTININKIIAVVIFFKYSLSIFMLLKISGLNL